MAIVTITINQLVPQTGLACVRGPNQDCLQACVEQACTTIVVF